MRRIPVLLIAALAAAIGAAGQVNTINTVAGGGTQPTAATSAYLPQPYDAVRDTLGNTYISVPTLNTVYKVDTGGNLTIYAGTGIYGFSGDGGPATSAQLAFPYGLAIDKNGNLFIADFYNNRIRRVDAMTHDITTVAGSGDPVFGGTYGGDGGAATIAHLNGPQGVAVDANGNLFITDTFNGIVRRVDANTQVITLYAGGGTSTGCGTGSPLAAGFQNPVGIAVDANENVFISDQTLQVVCEVNASQTISTYAGTLNTHGTPGQANGDGGPAASAQFYYPSGLATDATGNLYIADSGEPRIRKVDTTTNHIITSIAGTGLICTNAQEPACGDGGAATSAALDYPQGVFVDSNNNIVIADSNNMRVRVVASGTNPIISALVGGGNGGDGGMGTSGILGLPQQVAVDGNENVYAFETNAERVRRLDATTQDLSTVAGNGYGGATETCTGTSCTGGAANGDGGPATQARFVYVTAFTTDATGNFYIADGTAEVVRVVNNQTTPITVAGVTIQPGNIQTVAGDGLKCGATGNSNALPACGDGGAATSASLYAPYGVAVDAAGNVYIADAGLNTVRIINADGTITTYAGTPGQSCSTYTTTGCGNYGSPTSALLNFPSGLATSNLNGNSVLYIADSGDNVIREVGIQGDELEITTVAFNGEPTFGGDDGSALSASMNFPQQVAVDNLGNLFVGAGNDNVVRRIDASDGTVTTVAGDVNNLDGGFSGDGGPSAQAMLDNYGLAIFNTAQGTHDLFIADPGNNRIRKVPLAPVTIEDGSSIVFGPTIAGTENTSPQSSVSFANDGLDDLVLTMQFSGSSAFQVPPPNLPGGGYVFEVSPGNAGTVPINFLPPAGVPGPFTGTVTITTNDPNNPSFSFSVTGTVGGAETLNVSINPTGDGNIISTSGTIDCPTYECTGTFAMGSTVELIASGNSGFAFQSWNIANAPDAANCASDMVGVCTFTITQTGTIAANFTPVTTGPTSYTVTLDGLGNGSGTVTSTPAGINCTIMNGVGGASGCSATFSSTNAPNGVTLTATALTGGSVFAGWLGEICSGQGTCTVPALTLTVAPVFSGPPQPFASGQVFLSTSGGLVFVLNPANGNVIQVLNSGNSGLAFGQGMTFDTTGNLYLAQTTGNIEEFNNQGAGPTLFGNGNCPCDNEAYSVVSAPSGDILVGEAFITGDEEPTVLDFAQNAGPTGKPSATYYPAYERGAAPLWIELLDTNDRFAYTLGSQTLKVFNFTDGSQRPDIATTLEGAYALRELPDKTLLVADTNRIVRIDQSGNIQQTYTIPGVEANFENLNLDPDGATFWTDDQLTGIVYRLNIQTGAVVNTGGFITSLGYISSFYSEGIGGIAVYKQPSSGGADLSVTMTAPASVQSGSNVVYNITVVNNGPLNATGVTLTASIPNALPAGLSPSNCTSVANGTTTNITCLLGSISSGQSVPAVFTMTPTITSGTISATASVSGGQADPYLTNNTATATTTVTSSGTFILTVTESGTGSGTVSSTSPNPPDTILCPSTCSASFASGTAVTLTVTPNGGSTFAGWGGACTGTSSTCTVTMTAAESVTATFNLSSTGGGGLTIASTTLPAGAVTVPYGADIPVSGGTPPYTVALTTGSSLPSGFSMDATATGNAAAGHVYNLAPKTAGTYTFGVKVTDSTPSAPQTATATISLTIAAMPANTQPGLLNGQYAFLVRAFDETTGTEHAVVGSFTFDGKGNITAGEIDNNSPGTNGIYNAQVTGVYSIGSDNRGMMSVTPTGQTPGIFTIAVGGVSGGVASNATVTLFLDDDATGQIGSGMLVKQNPSAFTKASFAGTYAFGLTGQDQAFHRAAELGLITFDASGNVTSATQDVNDNGETVKSTLTGVYTGPDSNGRIVQTNNGNTSPNDVIYLISANEGIAVTVDARASNPIFIGSGFRQASGAFSSSSLAGPDVLSVAGVSSGGTEALVGVLTATAGTSPSVSLTSDADDGGNLMLNSTQTGSYTVTANGLATLNFTTPVTIYLWQKDHGFVMSTDSSVSFGELVPQTGGPFSASSFSGAYFLGQQEMVQGEAGEFSGVGTASGSSLSLTGDVSHSGGDLSFDQSEGSLSFSIGTNGHFTIPQSATAGALTGYMVSPTEVVFFDTTGPSSDPTPSVHPQLTVAQSVIGAAAAAPALAITKTHTGNFVLGLQGSYTITISNATGAGATSGTVTVTDNAPDGLTIYSMSGTGWACDGDVCNRSDALAGGASYPAITVVVNVAGNAVSPQVNSATVSGGGSASATANDTTVVAPPLPVATLNPANGSTIAFGDEGVGSTSPAQKVTLTNTGNVSLAVSSIAVTENGGSGDFAETNDCPETLPPSPATGSSCTINVTFTPSATGKFSGTLTVATGDPNHPSQAIQLTGTGAIVTITAGPGSSTTVTVNPGQTAVYGVTLSAPPGVTGTVLLTCTSPDATITCLIVPSSVILNGTAIRTAIVVNTYCQGSVPVGDPARRFPIVPTGALSVLAALLMIAMPKTQRRRLRLALVPAALAVVLIVNASCGSLPKNAAGPTPAGTYTLNITASLGNSSFTMPVTLIVK